METKYKLFLVAVLLSVQKLSAVELSLPQLSGKEGQTIEIAVTTGDLTGLNVVSFQFELDGFNPQNIKVLGVITAGTLSAGFGSVSYRVSNQRLVLAGAGSVPLAGSGVLFKIEAKLLRESWQSLGFYTQGTNLLNEGLPAPTFTNGHLSIESKPRISVYPSETVLAIGDELSFSAWGGAPPYTWQTTSPQVATFGIDGLLKALKKGRFDVVSTDANGFSGTSDGEFKVAAFKIRMRDTSVLPETVADIPVYFDNLDGTLVYSGSVDIGFNQSICWVLDVLFNGTVLASAAQYQYHIDDGRVSISFAASSPITQSGILAWLRVRTTTQEWGSTQINPANALVNELEVVKNVPANLAIKSLSALGINGSGNSAVAGDHMTYTAWGGNPPYTWEVDHPELAEISPDGVLHALKSGVVTVSVRDVPGARGRASELTIYDTRVGIRDTTVKVFNGKASVPVYIGALPSGKSFSALSGRIVPGYNTIIDSLVVSASESLCAAWMMVQRKDQDAVVIAASSSQQVNTGGVLVRVDLYFNNTVRAYDAIRLDLQDLVLDEGQPTALVYGSNVTVGSVETALDGHKDHVFSVFPNPSARRFLVEPGAGNWDTWQLYNALGKNVTAMAGIVLAEGRFSVDLVALPSGIYTLRIKGNSSVVTTKLIKE